ncbi:hypothetical protein DEO72_LG6g1557 [Vigna unguiculata]|uniref:Uncharacterized protein n=1 Tax=Vigna unguiculata TaxID=3917 RepID=A0A4D6M7G0_VIGUN|nr:hypothetical protein DEO72_LG6g1557 [Vigna unguiculata]
MASAFPGVVKVRWKLALTAVQGSASSGKWLFISFPTRLFAQDLVAGRRRWCVAVMVDAQFVVSARFCDSHEWRKMVVARRVADLLQRCGGRGADSGEDRCVGDGG